MKKIILPLTLQALEDYFNVETLDKDTLLGIKELSHFVGHTLIQERPVSKDGNAKFIASVSFDRSTKTMTMKHLNGNTTEITLSKVYTTTDLYVLMPDYD